MAAARTYQHPEVDEIALSRVLFALSEPLRLAMVHALATRGEVDSIELGPGLPRTTLTHHTSLLRESGVVFVRAAGRKCLIKLRTDDLDARFPGLIDTVLAGYEPDSGAAEDDQ
ncbi:transcriptional regulator [Nocardia panacis]|uniref:Transcriptional regulator n=1 Tax=Nocardia panacis TaxID=2340916 RepID=A0A3A4KIG6_9NOCA|nr:helix-turn-helix transcriptional regulator [Nocardia panacis]RJO79419.1 transcriptional regulator [Nocardia panacis]